MYPPRHFAEHDLAALDALIERDRFITLVTVADGAPVVTHLPVLYRRDGERVELIGHWARSNPQARGATSAKAIVHGPDAYVSPSWYPDKDEQARVPTWNYAVAHLDGVLETFDDEASLAALVDALSREHEALVGQDWRFEVEREDQRVQLRGIIGFRLRVENVRLIFKLNQNHPEANVRSVAAQLSASGAPQAGEVAALMLDRLARRD
jgi:transcriptional regulator